MISVKAGPWTGLWTIVPRLLESAKYSNFVLVTSEMQKALLLCCMQPGLFICAENEGPVATLNK